MADGHSFHIPVMGIGFTIDTALKAAPLGIDSVMFIGDDQLIEKLREMYYNKFDLPYEEIPKSHPDWRAKRIRLYLNMINDQVNQQMEKMIQNPGEYVNEINYYFDLLPDTSEKKAKYFELVDSNADADTMKNWLKEHLTPGKIDVNIMTKLDRENYQNKEQLPQEFNDAHAALRGFATSDLDSTIVFSAGMNPRLFAYLESLEDFYPDVNGQIKKKVALKVSDYRSASIQGKFLAKKGIWVSEYRIESGLNCGGHAFPTDGYLMGPILSEFKEFRQELIDSTFEVLSAALTEKEKVVPASAPQMRVTAQGGVGIAEEHNFLLNHYQLDSIGWGSPFLLVPEFTNVGDPTIKMLCDAGVDDMYLSDISPLGVPFNNLKGNEKEIEKLNLIAKGRPGSACPKKALSINKEFTDTTICTASRQYQDLKLKELDALELSKEEYDFRYKKIISKSCLCTGLGTSPLVIHDLERKREGDAVLVCPGPNLAYFTKILSPKEMIDHIYGRTFVIGDANRPNLFMKELGIYLIYLQTKMDDLRFSMTQKDIGSLNKFVENLEAGIAYYTELFQTNDQISEREKLKAIKHLEMHHSSLKEISAKIEQLTTVEH